MSEAPKKIWFDKDYLTIGFQAVDDRDIPYIRADIVDELVEALKDLIKFCAPSEDWDDEEIIKARAALAKLEESHE